VVSRVRQGDVFWIDFGSPKGSAPADRHPCVVVQSDNFNQSAISTTVVCLITSNLRHAQAPGNVALRRGDSHLPKASVVNVSQVATVDKTDLVERIGKLPPATVDLIRTGLQLLFDRI
jgi:mRNA interferase MazF